MGSRELFYNYKETRVSLEPTPATVVNATVPAVSGGRRISGRTGHGGGSGSGRGGILGGSSSNSSFAGDNYTEEERAYRAKSLATESSIFHRKHHDSPRSFLWRVLERGHVLSIRAIDIGKPDAGALDAPLTLYLHFPKPIRPGCVALADPPQHDALTVFVLDESFHLHHLQLRPDVFRKRSFSEADLGEAWRPYLSATFNFKQPRRLVAVSANEFVVALNDGGLISFRRDHARESSSWNESFHSPVGLMQGLRSILPFQGGPTIKYEGSSLEITAAASAVVTCMGLDVTFMFSVCLDHRLRVWNVGRGEVCYTGDVLGLRRDPHETGRWTVDPSQTNLIRVVDVGKGLCICVTYSPVGAGAFKIWRAKATDDGKVTMEPFAGAESPLVPPTPTSSDVWTLADFVVSQPDQSSMSLWVLWKNNLIYRAMKLECLSENLGSDWEHGWQGVHTESSLPTAQTSGPCDPTDAAEKWLDLIFYPGRFSKATLETALAMYERGLGAAHEGSAQTSGKSLMESICSALGSAATLERTGSGAMDYDLFRSAGEIQWRRFYRLLVELDKQRGEALSLALDPELGLAWVVCTDCVAAIRECSKLEQLCHNGPSRTMSARQQKVSRLLTAGFTFLESFSDGMLQQSEAALRPELFEDSSKTDEERMQYLSDKAGFWRHLTEDECAQVVDVLGDNFEDVEESSYEELFSLLKDVHTPDVRYPLSQFGRKLAIRGIQDSAELLWQVLFRQLILLVHMEFEVEDEKSVLHSRLDVGQVYIRLVESLKRLELIRWLAKNEFSVALSRSARESLSGSFSASFSGSMSATGSFSGGSPSANRRGGGGSEESQVVTVLEASVSHLLGLASLSGLPLASLLTDMIVEVCSTKNQVELDPTMIQCMLLKRERPDLSLQLGSFSNDDPFSTYVQGRTFLALRDWDTAAEYFKKAAVGLSVKLRLASRHSAGLIDESEWNLFYSGLPNYYAHIVALYDRQKAYSFVIDFARLSLQFSRPGSRGGGSDALTTATSADAARMDMLSRQFTAATALARFDLAHTVLQGMGSDAAMQQACLRFLVEKMAETGQVAQLMGLPFPGLRDAVDGVLEHKCRAAMEVMRGTQWHQILYGWRIAHNDYRGAAAVLLDRLQKLQQAGEGDKFVSAIGGVGGETDVLDTPVTRQYLMLINTLSCVEPKQAWIYTEDLSLRVGSGGIDGDGDGDSVDIGGNGEDADDSSSVRATVEVDGDDKDGLAAAAADTTTTTTATPPIKTNGTKHKGTAVSSGSDAMAELLKKAAAAKRQPWRKVVTLADIRKQYQDELDRIAAIQNNQFEFGDDEDVSMADD
ncbi:hypothetical protein CMQ_441 [Grosmannia clavigera kw1407]|uniref:Uncharacterized protein n=1 Tax=Grosmannia clavigera (strain kw1407 / UAMH 11150) TaxID=655863 RepID=F0XDU3_GROCL|nr:uncharacterized protein CMQ_441 [Grosmannia clavigera kw1407]EFX03513.1 hypothetical protein CMQ_441 [Grosmannia clavigera kw1407]